jgi:hypothetical protein
MDEAIPLRCPTCGAADQSGVQCRRCRTDLRLLRRLEQARAREMSLLAAALDDGRWDDALTSAQYAHHLLADETSRRHLAVCQLLAGRFEEACLTWQSGVASRGDSNGSGIRRPQ